MTLVTKSVFQVKLLLLVDKSRDLATRPKKDNRNVAFASCIKPHDNDTSMIDDSALSWLTIGGNSDTMIGSLGGHSVGEMASK